MNSKFIWQTTPPNRAASTLQYCTTISLGFNSYALSHQAHLSVSVAEETQMSVPTAERAR